MTCLCFVTCVFILAIAYEYSSNGASAAFSLDMAAVFGVIVSPFAYVVRAYFGDLRSETESRHSSINGIEKLGGLAQLVKVLKR
jgi:hypothetical protein